jgi:hypothetical protein
MNGKVTMGDVIFYGLGVYCGLVLLIEFVKHVNRVTDRDA